MVSHRAIG
jgi:hypothetical protein